jgi:pantoate--beta-alanine ligase
VTPRRTIVIDDPAALVGACDRARAAGARVGVVPTMGALHRGHLALVDGVRREGASFVVVTIFVNPLQFGPNEDFARYPRTFEADLEACRARDVDVVFAPPRERMYPAGHATAVRVRGITERFEGVHRPTHFEGVTTVVLELFELTQPCVAIFGRKDYQQWRVIERMTADLHLRADVRSHPIVREHDGLALSSRNRYLDARDRERARALSQGLLAARAAYDRGERDAEILVRAARSIIEPAVDRIDYVALADRDTLEPIEGRAEAPALLVACHVGSTRLIDNTVLGSDDFRID